MTLAVSGHVHALACWAGFFFAAVFGLVSDMGLTLSFGLLIKWFIKMQVCLQVHIR